MSGKEMKVRIMAGTIRARLLGRHSNPTFRRVLANMTDSELVDRQAQFHADSWDGEPAKAPFLICRVS